MASPSMSSETLHMQLPEAFPEGARLFRVTRDGSFDGRVYRAGELALVDGSPGEGDSVVLVAIGHGRPRLGRVAGTQLLGDQGEPCHLSRWEVAGRLRGVVRPVGAGWAVEMFDRPGVVGMTSAPVASSIPVHAPAPQQQLSLFAA